MTVLRAAPDPTNKQAPYNPEAEDSALGAAMLSEDAAADVVRMLSAEDFYNPRNRAVFSVLADLLARSIRPDAILVGEELARRGTLADVGGKPYLFTLVNSVPTPGSAPWYAKTVLDHARLRRLIDACSSASEIAYGLPEDVDAALDEAETDIFNATRATERHEIRSMSVRVSGLLAEMEAGPRQLVGVSTGLRDLDAILLGLEPGNLYVIAARPSMGKTSLVTSIARDVAGTGTGVLFISLEMSADELTRRMLATEAGVSSTRLKTWDLTPGQVPMVMNAMGVVSELPLLIDDKPKTTVLDIRSRARRLAKEGIGLIVIDYLTLLEPPKGRRIENKTQEVSEISRALKILAREVNVPVVVLSQLNRNVEFRADKRPLLADLRDSGSVEQDADVVMLLYRDEYYNQQSKDRGICEVNIAKNRNGPIGVKKLQFTESLTRFADLAYGSTS